MRGVLVVTLAGGWLGRRQLSILRGNKEREEGRGECEVEGATSENQKRKDQLVKSTSEMRKRERSQLKGRSERDKANITSS